jgi:monovalent cation:H+ antiporter-2, CPA2 family
MAGPVDIELYREPLVILTTAAIVVPLFHRLRISPVLGFMLSGMLLGPHVLGALTPYAPWLGLITISDMKAIQQAADFGVVFLMFAIGLELSLERLALMRKLVFGLGSLQILVSATGIGLVAMLFGVSPVAAAVIGLALCLSSTAIVVQVLANQKRLTNADGRTAFAVLLAQDLAVVPILLAVAMLARGETPGGIGELVLALLPAVIAVVAIFVAGLFVLRPLFRLVARTRSPELFMAACLLVVLATGLAAAGAGLSMALGAFIAGLLLAETEYRRQVEVTIEPFKGLLLGVFLVSIGMSVDLGLLVREPLATLAAAVALIIGKATVVVGLGLLFGVKPLTAFRAGLLLGPGGEFAFVVIAAAVAAGAVSGGERDFVLLVATLTMAMIPALAALTHLARSRSATEVNPEATPVEAAPEAPARVLIAGYGRVGQIVSDLLDAHQIPWLAVDSEPEEVARLRRKGKAVYLGDASRPEILHACHIEDARALIVTMDSSSRVEAVVRAARSARDDLPIVARARDAANAAILYSLGVRDAVPETVEASLQVAEAALFALGQPAGRVIASIHEKRDAERKRLMAAAAAADAAEEPGVRLRARTLRAAIRPTAGKD